MSLPDYAELTVIDVQPTYEAPNANLYDINYAQVYYATDDFQIPGVNNSVTLKEVEMVAWSNSSYNDPKISPSVRDYGYNWIGLGLASGQSIVHNLFSPINGQPYPTFGQNLISAGMIESNTYSIWLDETAKKSGHLLMGGINSQRYKGSLVNLRTSLNSTSDDLGLRLQAVLSVGIDFVGIDGKPIANTTVENVVLAHSSLTYLSRPATKALWEAVGATWNDGYPLEQTQAKVPCSFLTNSSTIDIKFTGTNLTLSVPMSSITSKWGEGPFRGNSLYADSCALLVMAVGTGLPAILGTTILRNLYTVYDLTNNIISVALTDFESKKDNVIAIPVEGVAAIKKEAFGSEEIVTPSTSASPSPSNSTVPNDGAGGSNKGVIIGVGVAIPVVVILALAGAFILFRRRKARKSHAVGEEQGGDVMHSKAELADDQKPFGEAMGNSVSEVDGSDGKGAKHELDAAKVERQELSADQRHELP